MEEIKYKFRVANKEDKKVIMSLYREAIGSKGCTWSMDYPNEEIFDKDVERQDLFCIVNDAEEIIGAISVDMDEVVDSLDCWDKKAGKMSELARLVIKQDYRNKGLAPRLIMETVKVLKERNYATVHYLVSKYNEIALAAYSKLNFEKVGETDILHNDWYCYEYNVLKNENV